MTTSQTWVPTHAPCVLTKPWYPYLDHAAQPPSQALFRGAFDEEFARPTLHVCGMWQARLGELFILGTTKQSLTGRLCSMIKGTHDFVTTQGAVSVAVI